MSLSGFGGNPAGFAGRAKCEEFYSSGHIRGRWAYGGDVCSGTVRAFGSLVTTLNGGLMEGAPVLELIEHSVLEKPLDGGPLVGMSVLESLEHLVGGNCTPENALKPRS